MNGPTNGGRERAYQALRESEELHRATLSNISDAVFLADDTGAFTFICPNVDVIFGYAPDEVQAMGGMSQFLGEGLFDRADLESRGEIRNVEREITSKTGERRTILVHFKRVSIQNGTVLCTCRDVTELRQTERRLAAAQIDLAHAARLALVGELTASVMHEIGQPLMAIVANAAAGFRYTKDRPELNEIFDEIERAAADAAQIIERQRTLVRKRPLERQPVDMNAIATDVMNLVAADAYRRRVTLSAELAPLLPALSADRVSLQQVLLNLIMNAMDAVEGNADGARQVAVRTSCEADVVAIEVRDTGHGIPADHLPKVFDAFFTTKEQGVGLGLAVSRSIVEAHAGRIWAEDLAGRGATFRLALPIRPAGPVAAVSGALSD